MIQCCPLYILDNEPIWIAYIPISLMFKKIQSFWRPYMFWFFWIKPGSIVILWFVIMIKYRHIFILQWPRQLNNIYLLIYPVSICHICPCHRNYTIYVIKVAATKEHFSFSTTSNKRVYHSVKTYEGAFQDDENTVSHTN